jgi:methionine sulfoxide reductase heme-binding subunit
MAAKTATGPIDRINGLMKRVPVLPLYFVALIPGALLFWQALTGHLGVDPMKGLEHGLGLWALKFIIATLAVTPLMRWPGLRLLRFRRMLGLTAFYYMIAHLSVYIALDQQFGWNFIIADILKRPYITFGMLAFIALVPLAITSTDGMVRRLGALAWRNLHRLIYPAALLMALHYLWLVKSWTAQPLAYAAIIVVLLALRLVPKRRARQRVSNVAAQQA